MSVFDKLGEQIAREQDALLARHNAQAEVRARLSELDLQTLQSQPAERVGRTNALGKRAKLRWLAPAGLVGVMAAAAAVLLWWARVYDVASPALAVQLAETHAQLR
ncbi:MAG: hypothetical protein RL701_2414, partial [Pseudomonadota bacterium]